MANNNTAIIVIGMILIVALTMYGPVTQGFGNLIDTAWENWGQLFGDGFGLSEGSSTIGLLMHYADGTTHEYKPEGQPLSIVDPDPNKIVTWIEPTCYVTLSKSGYVQSWSLTGYQKTELREATGSADPIHTWEKDFTDSGSTWSEGESKAVSSQRIQADDIESLLAGAGYSGIDGQTFKLRFYGKLKTASVTFEDGTTDSIETGHISPFTTYWTFLWVTSGITSIDLTISYPIG